MTTTESARAKKTQMSLMESKRNTLLTVESTTGGGETGFVVTNYAQYNN